MMMFLLLLFFPISLLASNWSLSIPGFFQSFHYSIQPTEEHFLKGEIKYQIDDLLHLGFHVGGATRKVWFSKKQWTPSEPLDGNETYQFHFFGPQVSARIELSELLSGLMHQSYAPWGIFLEPATGIGWGSIEACDAPDFCNSVRHQQLYAFQSFSLGQRFENHELGVQIQTQAYLLTRSDRDPKLENWSTPGEISLFLGLHF